MSSKSKAAPWGEAHRREAYRRSLEIAAELVGARGDDYRSPARYLAAHAPPSFEVTWRADLAEAGIDPARINREVRRVHLLATGVLVRRKHDTMTPIDRHSEERGHYKARVRKTTIRKVK